MVFKHLLCHSNWKISFGNIFHGKIKTGSCNSVQLMVIKWQFFFSWAALNNCALVKYVTKLFYCQLICIKTYENGFSSMDAKFFSILYAYTNLLHTCSGRKKTWMSKHWALDRITVSIFFIWKFLLLVFG